MFRRFVLAASLLVLTAGHASADERILDYVSTIVVHQDTSLTITEAITVRAENSQIRHGIYRDFPTRYVDERGDYHTATFDVQSVKLDDQPVQYRLERQSGRDVRLYIGDPDVFVDRGVHTYVITYRSERQLGFYDDFDEVYWNVTGNRWIFPIDHVEVTVRLPQSAPILTVDGYTGPVGSKSKDFDVVKQSDAEVVFRTRFPLLPAEGFTIAVDWPTGYVTRPSGTDKAIWFLRDNLSAAAGLLGLAITLLYFLRVWDKVGRDPQAGIIVPQYEPPNKFTPAGCRYVVEMGYDQKAFTAALVNIAVKGAIKIREDDSEYTIEKADPDKVSVLSKGERKIFNILLGPDEFIRLKQSNHTTLQSAQKAFRRALAGEFERTYFARNTSYFLPGVMLAAVTLLGIIVLSPNPGPAFGISFWLGGWSLGCYFLLYRAKSAWLGVLNAPGLGDRIARGFGAIFQSLFALPFLVGLVLGATALNQGLSYIVVGIIALLIVTCLGFYHLLKAPTLLGRRALDHIEGFKRYLSVAEKDRMEFHNPPDRTPELFEKFLPYALALGVENQWSEQFDDVLAKASVDGTYHPAWYVGRGFYPGHYGDIGHSLGSGLNGAVSSASASPRSSGSGGGGGGSSGGGGGGGGGGGW